MEFDPFNVNGYTLEQLIQYLKDGITFEEMQQCGLNWQMQEKVKGELAKVEELKRKEESDWRCATEDDTEDAYIFYISKWSKPEFKVYARHLEQAQFKIDRIGHDREILLMELLEDMRINPWKFRQAQMKMLLSAGKLTEEQRNFLNNEQGSPMANFLLAGLKLKFDDLRNGHVIPDDVTYQDLVAADYSMPATKFADMVKSRDDFPSGRTDVYFLGVPRSGKTAVLSGIIYKLWKDGIAGYEPHLVDGRDPCWQYYEGLIRTIGSKKPAQGTAKDTISFMKVNITSHNRENHLNMFEMSGESFLELSKKYLIGPQAWEELGATQCILNNNRKLLFFVLDYSIISSKTVEFSVGHMDQLLSLQATLNAFVTDGPDPKHPDRNCTMSKVDSVAVIMTKSDLMDADTNEERLNIAEDYINTYFAAFMNELFKNCQKFGINSGNRFSPYILTFSLGQFYIGNTVIFDGTDSSELINFISAVTAGEKTGGFRLF